jgi:hypothetical protein
MSYERPPDVSYAFWGKDPAHDAAVALEISQHVASWNRQQRLQEDAQALGDRIRDAILDGGTTRAAVLALLVEPAPPRPTMFARLRTRLRRAVVSFQRLYPWSTHAQRT